MRTSMLCSSLNNLLIAVFFTLVTYSDAGTLGNHGSLVSQMKSKSLQKGQVFCSTDHNRDRLQRRRKRYAYSKSSNGIALTWDSDTVTWAITRPSRQVSEAKQRRMMRDAMAKWSAVTPLNFVEVRRTQTPDVSIIFARREHGPSYDPVFDGAAQPGRPNSLGHAWGPGTDRSSQNGDVHFDEDDDWTDDMKFLGVAVHELGHSMGLMHSKDPEAVMFPAYRETADLGPDDIRGAQYLYGSRGGTPRPPRPRTTPRPTRRTTPRRRIYRPDRGRVRPTVVVPTKTTLSPDSHCLQKRIDAVVKDFFSDIPGFYYVIMGDTVYHILHDGTVSSHFPYEAMFPGVPTRPDVVFALEEKRSIYIIKDKRMWQMTRTGPASGMPKSLYHMRFPEKPNMALTMSDFEGNRKVYLFGRSYWWDIEVNNLTMGPHHEIRKFSKDYPTDVIFATQWKDERLYAITHDRYEVIDLLKRTKIDDESGKGKPDWYNNFCQGPPPTSDDPTLAVILVIVVLIIIIISCIYLIRNRKKVSKCWTSTLKK